MTQEEGLELNYKFAWRIYVGLAALGTLLFAPVGSESDGGQSQSGALYTAFAVISVVGIGYLFERSAAYVKSYTSAIVAGSIVLLVLAPFVIILSATTSDINWTMFGSTYSLGGFLASLLAALVSYSLVPLFLLVMCVQMGG